MQQVILITTIAEVEKEILPLWIAASGLCFNIPVIPMAIAVWSCVRIQHFSINLVRFST